MITFARSLAALALAVLAVALTASPAAADGTAVPYHEIGAVECGQGFVRARPPRIMRPTYATDFRNAEEVYWAPELYRFNFATNTWDYVTWPGRWYRAYTSSYGYYQDPLLGGWTDMRTNASNVMFFPFYGLAPGYYAVKNYMHWSRLGATHEMWSQTVCQIQ
jgi:hypothetical protein